MSDAFNINVFKSVNEDSRSINYKNIIFVNDTSRAVRMMAQLGASLTDYSGSIIYSCNVFIVEATGVRLSRSRRQVVRP